MVLDEFNTDKNFKISFADTFYTQNKYKCFSIIEKNENVFFNKANENTNENDYNYKYKIILNNLKKKKVHYRSNAIVWICKNCGYTHIGIDAPLICPICNLPQNYFELQNEA